MNVREAVSWPSSTVPIRIVTVPRSSPMAVQSIGNLAYHAVVGRALTPDDYGALGAVLSAMTLVAVPLTALQTAAARTTATHGLSRSTFLTKAARRMIHASEGDHAA